MITPLAIGVAPGQVTIDWDGDSTHVISARELRSACPCAACRTPDGIARTDKVVSGLLAVTIDDVSMVGEYALSIRFQPDAHGTGIFPYTLLHTIGAEGTK